MAPSATLKSSYPTRCVRAAPAPCCPCAQVRVYELDSPAARGAPSSQGATSPRARGPPLQRRRWYQALGDRLRGRGGQGSATRRSSGSIPLLNSDLDDLAFKWVVGPVGSVGGWFD